MTRGNLILEILIVTTLLAGCAQEGPPIQEGPVVITFACDSYWKPDYEALAGTFHAQDPDIIVQVVSVDFSRGGTASGDEEEQDRITELLRLLSGSGDAFHWFPSEATRPEYVLDLTPLTDRLGDVDPGDFYAGALDAFRSNGGFWGLPYQINLSGMIAYDREALTGAGLTPPSLDWTREDMREMVWSLTETEMDRVTRWGFVDTAVGRSLTLLAGISLSRLDTPGMADAVHWYLDMVLLDRSTPWRNGYADPAARTELNRLTRPGRAAMWTVDTIGYYRSAGRVSGRGLGLAVLPGGRAMPQVWGVALSATTPYPQEALRWAEFLTRHPLAPGFVPARRSTAKGWTFGSRRDEEATAACLYALERSSTFSPDIGTRWEPLAGAIDLVVDEDIPVEDALVQAQETWQEKMDHLAARPTSTAAPIVVVTPRPVSD